MDDQQGIPPQQPMPPSPPSPTEAEEMETRVQADASLVVRFFQADPGAQAIIDRTIRQQLQGGVNAETWGNILGGLTLYAGEDVARLVLTTLLSADELVNPDDAGPGYLALVEQHVGAETWSYLRGLMAMYSPGIKEAYAIAGENPQASRIINRRVFFDEVTGAWQASFEIIKYNGERLYLEETPTTAIGLCNAILDTLNFVPGEKAQQFVDPNAVESLVSLSYAFVERFAPDLLKEETD
jgi:hypothetical protein